MRQGERFRENKIIYNVYKRNSLENLISGCDMPFPDNFNFTIYCM